MSYPRDERIYPHPTPVALLRTREGPKTTNLLDGKLLVCFDFDFASLFEGFLLDEGRLL